MASQLLSLLHLSSPSLPIGAFAYSQGLESAIDIGWVDDEDALKRWLQEVMTHSLANLDLPLIQRLYSTWQEQASERVQYWQQVTLANRESAELVTEEQRLGATFSRLLVSLDLAPEAGFESPTYLSMYAFAAQKMAIPMQEALSGWLWSWLENQVMVACKTIPLGQTPAQRILLQLNPTITECVEKGMAVEDDEIGMTLPALAMVSAWHEQQYSRLFRS
ncbi:urease accessory protein UreF [Corallincola platygyrae]|uniref:Urease accessory protein UreF n=1 Tax=Corallincola platygyrae TaxID=1193278 RepID=A0ABW4XK58_9GAMM